MPGDAAQGDSLCTVRLARRLLPQLPRRNLDRVSPHFGVRIEGRHRADGDALATAHVLVRLLEKPGAGDRHEDRGCSSIFAPPVAATPRRSAFPTNVQEAYLGVTAPQPLVDRGLVRVHAIQAGGQRLDGGAMFGVVPKTLWERRIPADAKNRIPMGMRCLLVETTTASCSSTPGSATRRRTSSTTIYGVENAGATDAPRGRAPALGFTPEDVALVINTHLHFDHAGGNTWRTPSGTVEAVFPKARYVVQRGEMEWATHTNERTGASYFGANWDAVVAAGRARPRGGRAGGPAASSCCGRRGTRRITRAC